MGEDLPSGARIIVGVEDSPASRWALAWALAEARLRRLPLVAVHVSRAPLYPSPEALPYDHTLFPDEAERSQELVTRLFGDVAGGVPDEALIIIRVGHPGRHLVDLARAKDLLVLGRGTRSWLSRLILPSARRYCARYARATLVTVQPVPAADKPEPAPGSSPLRRWWVRIFSSHADDASPS
ncbi:universal stress protein [Nonomuraea basaltis]|uniref:universal stress protein n=1 Tax=Nonomuraea basaltis TaxID=2495887 RepID=UPI00110C4F89|nr:universal stress protein [Nonomuraea basaltis]TMR90146.1 universal stress protein [Nonomuraea basaltis]